MNKKLFLTLLCTLFCYVYVMAGASEYYAKLTAVTGTVTGTVTGVGKVYVSEQETSSPLYTKSSHSLSSSTTTSGGDVAFYVYAQNKYGYKFSSWKVTKGEATIKKSSVENGCEVVMKASSTADDATKATTATVSALYTQYDETFGLTFLEDEGIASYSVSNPMGYPSVSVGKTVPTHDNDAMEITAKGKPGYTFDSWYIYDASGNVIKTDNKSCTLKYTFSEESSVVAKFKKGTFKVGYDIYEELDDAVAAAESGSTKTVVVSADCSVSGTHTIPSGITLLVPFDDDYTLYTTKPGTVYPGTDIHKPYCTLTLAENAVLNVYGSISVSSKINAVAGSIGDVITANGSPSGSYGYIIMNEDSKINLKSGSALYVPGYISGAGIITAESGSVVYETLQIMDWRGGSASSSMKHGMFPFNQYYVQNIEPTLVINSGATEDLYVCVGAKGDANFAESKLLGDANSYFIMSKGATVTKRYDKSKDNIVFDINGQVKVNGMTVTLPATLGSMSINSNDYNLPLTNNMMFNVHANSNVEFSQDALLSAGTVLIIDANATVSVNSKTNLYVFDSNEWDTFGNKAKIRPLTYVPSTDNNLPSRTIETPLSDAKITVNGTLEINGFLYTTESGADICSDGGGIVKMNAESGSTDIMYMAKSFTTNNGNVTFDEVAINLSPALLHNSDDTYTTTANVPANSTFKYVDGYWVLDGVNIRVYKPGSIESEKHTLDKWPSLQTDCPNAIAMVEKSKVTSNFDEYFTNIVVNNNGDLSCNNFVITDKEPIYVPDNFKASKLTYTRTGSNTWGTVCMPFALESNDDIQYYKFKKLDLVANCMTFEEVTEVEPNTPAIYSLSEGITELNLGGENCELVEYENIPVVYDDLTLYGVINQDCATLPVSDNSPYYYIAKNKFWQPTKNQVTVYPYRAYFMANNPEVNNTKVFDIVKSEKSDNEDMFGEMEEQPTSILILPEGVTITQYYNAAGVKVAQPQKGVNIIKLSNGQIKKIIIK